jgi:chaperonin GroEL
MHARFHARQSCQNEEFEGSIVVKKLLEEKNKRKGYDAAKGKLVDMFDEVNIDPTKVVRTALVDSSGVASLMITTEAMIFEMTRDEKAGGAPGGMGGMDGIVLMQCIIITY